MRKEDLEILINALEKWDVSKLGHGQFERTGYHTYRYRYGNENLKINLYKNDGKSFKLKLDGYTYEVVVKDDLDILIEQLGFNKGKSQKITEIQAPMPGLVLEVFVNEGDQISSGDRLLVLEAMKMENIIKAEGEGRIAAIHVAQGDKVEKGQVFLTFE